MFDKFSDEKRTIKNQNLNNKNKRIILQTKQSQTKRPKQKQLKRINSVSFDTPYRAFMLQTESIPSRITINREHQTYLTASSLSL